MPRTEQRVVARPLGERAAPFGAVAIRLELAPSLDAGDHAAVTAEWRCGAHSGRVVYPIVIEK